MSDAPAPASNGDKEVAQDPHARVRAVFDDWAERGRAEGMESGHAFEAAGLTVVEQTGIRYPLAEGQAPTWKQTLGSLLTVGVRPA